MKKFLTVVGVLVGLVLLLGVFPYMALVGADEGRKEAWGNVESDLQRRSDLIPNLVSTVKGYAAHEDKVFTEVTQARAKLGGVLTDISGKSPSGPQLEQLASAQNQMASALSRLIAVAEAYPDLKASQNFLALQDQLEGTENRINTSRKRYNEAVKTLNTRARIFFYLGFSQAEPFAASKGADATPKVDFGG